MLITCENCQTVFKVTSAEIDFIETSRKKGSNFIILESCANCGGMINLDPQTMQPPKPDKGHVWFTPLSGCHGYVVKVTDSDESFYGCGKTGAVWFKKESFYRDIEAIIKKYPHRELFYTYEDGEWYPSEEQPKNYIELIETEEYSSLETFVRD